MVIIIENDANYCINLSCFATRINYVTIEMYLICIAEN